MSFDVRLIESTVRSAVSKEPEQRFVAVRSDALPEAVQTFEVDGESWQAHPVRSTLQARRVMAHAGDAGRRVLVTTILDDELGPEVMARLAQSRVHRIDPWKLVSEAFQAQQIDPRVTRESWMATALLQHLPAGGYPRVRAGGLDLDTAWAALSRALGFPSGEPSLGDWVEACAEDGFQERWQTLDEPLRAGLARRIEDRHGDAGAALVALLEGSHASAVVPLALVAAAVEAAPEDRERTQAEVRLEMTYGVARGIEGLGSVAGSWCEQALVGGHATTLEPVFEEAVRIAEACGASELLVGSSILPEGLEARLATLAACILEFVGDPQAASRRTGVETAAEIALEHRLIGRYPRFAMTRERVEGARRLVRWLGSPAPDTSSLHGAAQAYRDEGAWVDRVRYRLLRGTGASAWSQALARLAGLARERRERESATFAQALQRVTRGDEGAGEALLLENLYREVVAPMAERLPVLVVVLDGMSQAVFQELAQNIAERTSLRRMVQGSARSWPAVLAPLPTVTEVARASLICGELANGPAALELQGSRALAHELGWTAASAAQVLFHKGTLQQEGGGLSAAVLEALDSDAKVVTVVVNAVDDQLPKGGQLDVTWNLDTLRELEALLNAAEGVRRAVVLTADHGHVVELWESEADAAHPNEKGERWRAPGREPEERELEFAGARVLLPQPGGPVVLPWSEGLRYSARHAGYHGGASPQEAVVPLGVFVPGNAADELVGAGWDDELVAEPWWWSNATAPEEAPSESARQEPRVAATPRPRKPEPAGQIRMFEERSKEKPPTDRGQPAWIAVLFRSSVYESQIQSARTLRPNPNAIADFLAELDRMGGQGTFDGMRTRLSLTSMRFSSQMRLVARLLNFDGFAVLEIDEAAKTLRLDHGLLRQQFKLGEDV